MSRFSGLIRVLCLVILELFLARLSETLLVSKLGRRTCRLFAKNPSWMNRPEEEVLEIPSSASFESVGKSLFDTILVESVDDTDLYSISKMSLQNIAESYGFSLAYLGDFVVQTGCPPPIDTDAPISQLLTGDQIYTLLEAINSLDPLSANEEYDSVLVGELAEELGLTRSEMVGLCSKESVNLPFGLDTVVHMSVASRLRDLVGSGEFIPPSDDAHKAGE